MSCAGCAKRRAAIVAVVTAGTGKVRDAAVAAVVKAAALRPDVAAMAAKMQALTRRK